MQKEREGLNSQWNTIQEEGETVRWYPFRRRVRVVRWYTIQEEGESVQVEYHTGGGRRCPCRGGDGVQWIQKESDGVQLKVHKNENFFGSDFGICTFSKLVRRKY